MDYYEKRDTYVDIAHALRANGWKLYGYKEDQSDMMTDYYSPAYWTGAATKDDYVITNDSKESKGHDITELRDVPIIKCEKCNGSGVEPESEDWTLATARANPQAFHKWYDKHRGDGAVLLITSVVSPLHFRGDGKMKCDECGGKGEIHAFKDGKKIVVDHYPAYPACEKRVQFQLVNPDGKIIKKWFSMKQYHSPRYAQTETVKNNINTLIEEIDDLIKKDSSKDVVVINATKGIGKSNVADVDIVVYSERAVAVFGNTKPLKESFKELGGRFNMRLKLDGKPTPGWIFSKKVEKKLRELLNA